MKNKDLIALLQQHDPEAEVVKNKGDYVGAKYFPVSNVEYQDVAECDCTYSGTYYRDVSAFGDSDKIVVVLEIF